MGLDQRRRDQRAPQVDDLAGLGLGLGDPPVPNADLPRISLPGDPGALQEQIEHRQEASRDLNFQRLGGRFVQGEGPCRRLRKYKTTYPSGSVTIASASPPSNRAGASPPP